MDNMQNNPENFTPKGRKFHWGHGLLVALVGFAGGMGYLAYQSNQVSHELVEEDYADKDATVDARKVEETRGNRRATPEAYFEAGELVVKGPAVDLMIYGIGEARLYVPSDASKDVVWYWQNSLKPVPGDPSMATLRQKLESPPSGLAYLELSWSEKDGSAFKRIPVQFPVQ